MQYQAIRPLYGDFGKVDPGQVFDVPDWAAKRMRELEAKGLVVRYRAPRPRPVIDPKAVTQYQNKAIQPPMAKGKR